MTPPAAASPDWTTWRDPGGPGEPLPELRHELRFGERVTRCFAQRPANAWQAFERACEARPAAEALVCGDERLSWSALRERVEQAARGLRAHGVGAGDRVALLLGNRVEFVLALAATLRLGAIAVPMGTRLQTPELEYILRHCGARVLVHEAELASRLPAAAALPALERRVAVGGPAAGSLPWPVLAAAPGPAPAAPAIAEEDTALVLYTSGTTGHPKGAMLTHFNVVHSLLHYQHAMALGPRDRTILAVPASHVTGVVALVMTAWQAQGALVVMPEFKARDFLPLAARERITHTILVPAMYKLCLLQPDLDRHDLSAWRVGGYGGAPMPEATIAEFARRLPGLGLRNVYGSTETTSPATMMRPEDTARRPDSVGKALHCAEILVMTPQGREAAPGEAGELWIRGPMVVPGYWNDPEATARSFTAGYWRSGDVGSVDREGFVRVFDRAKDMINRGGYKVFSVEVENALVAHPGVVEAAVIARPCPVLGERVHAFVALRAPGAADPEALRRHCAALLADYKVPESFTIQDDPLPRNANGKLLKRVLRERLGESA